MAGQLLKWQGFGYDMIPAGKAVRQEELLQQSTVHAKLIVDVCELEGSVASITPRTLRDDGAGSR